MSKSSLIHSAIKETVGCIMDWNKEGFRIRFKRRSVSLNLGTLHLYLQLHIAGNLGGLILKLRPVSSAFNGEKYKTALEEFIQIEISTSMGDLSLTANEKSKEHTVSEVAERNDTDAFLNENDTDAFENEPCNYVFCSLFLSLSFTLKLELY